MIAIQIYGKRTWKSVVERIIIPLSGRKGPLKSHCWKNEKEIASTLQYGTLEDTNWEYGEVIKGMLTAELIRELLRVEVCQRMFMTKLTPYFYTAGRKRLQ